MIDRRGALRLGAVTGASVGTAGCMDTAYELLGGSTFDTLTIQIGSNAQSWRGSAEFTTGANTTVQVPLRGSGTAEFVIPDDLRDQSGVGDIENPITVGVAAFDGVSESDPLRLTVYGDDEKLGEDETTEPDTTVRVHRD